MSAQRARSAVAADHRSAHPDFPGVPWWGAVLIAVTATAIGFAFDAGSGSKELSMVFGACYAIGCIAAVLAVRQVAVFTAVIQPPLIMFVSVPGAYFLFTGSQIDGVRDVLINCGYPLIERFPLMFFTSAAVLVIGMLRWYRGVSAHRGEPRSTAADEPKTSVTTALTAKVSALFGGGNEKDEEVVEPPRRRRATGDRPTRAARAAGSASSRRERPARRSTPPRSRHVRPPETETIEPVVERPRRARSSRQEPPPSAERQRRETREPRRRPRPSRQSGQPPAERRAGYDRPERRRRFDDYDIPPREPHGRNGNGNEPGAGTHHPISRVRYRGEESDDRAEYRTRRRTPRHRDTDTWEYDI